MMQFSPSYGHTGCHSFLRGGMIKKICPAYPHVHLLCGPQQYQESRERQQSSIPIHRLLNNQLKR